MPQHNVYMYIPCLVKYLDEWQASQDLLKNDSSLSISV